MLMLVIETEDCSLRQLSWAELSDLYTAAIDARDWAQVIRLDDELNARIDRGEFLPDCD